jgi:hypothetical protein
VKTDFRKYAVNSFIVSFVATIGITLLLFFFPFGPSSGSPLSAVLGSLLPWLYLASLVAGLIALIATRRWKILIGGLVAVLGFVVFVSRFLRTCGCAPPEPRAISDLRTINTAQVVFLGAKGRYGNIEELINEGLLDSRYRESISAYRFSIQVSSAGDDYIATSRPVTKTAGKYGYYSNADAVVRYALDQDAACDPCFPIGQSGAPVQ